MGYLIVSYWQYYYIGGIIEDQFEGVLGFGLVLGVYWQLQGDLSYWIVLGMFLWYYVIIKWYSLRYFFRDWIWDYWNLYGLVCFVFLYVEVGIFWIVSKKISFFFDYQVQFIFVYIV